MRRLILSLTALLASTGYASADPISGFLAALSALSTALASGSVVAAFSGLTAFLMTPVGSLILAAGLSVVSAMFLRKTQKPPSVEAARINVRITEPDRWISAGTNRNGGGVLFCEFDSINNLWLVVVHSDSILVERLFYYLDDIKVNIDEEDHGVINTQFCLGPDFETIEDFESVPIKARTKFVFLWTTTFTPGNPVPPPVAELMAAFPGPNGWTADHKLVGTTYTVMKIGGIKLSHRSKIYKWRGPIGLGEPSLSVVGTWSRIYDPRDPEQDIKHPGTWQSSRNSALVWAWFRTHKYGRGKPMSSINWEKVAEQADICDQILLNISGKETPRYRTNISVPESKERSVAEQEILMSCDGQLVFDDDGKCWIRVGFYYEPTLRLSRNRDIHAMESVEAQNGESETQGVIVRYIDPDAKYVINPSAPWINPLYYVPGETPKYLNVDIPACQNHNQAMRLAKAIGMRSQSAYKIQPIVGLRGLRARQERIVDIIYDNTFAGDHEIVTPVEVDDSGYFSSFGAVPVSEDNWNLLPGEEKPRPVFREVEVTTLELSLPTGIEITFENRKIKIDFDEPPVQDWSFDFEIKADDEPDWNRIQVDMDKLYAYSSTLPENKVYRVRYRTRSTSGKITPWFINPTIIDTQVVHITGTPIVTGEVGEDYAEFTLSATGGTPPYLFVDIFNRLPNGLSINPSTGTVTGEPTMAGTFSNIVIRVQDSEGSYSNFPGFDITVSP